MHDFFDFMLKCVLVLLLLRFAIPGLFLSYLWVKIKINDFFAQKR